MPAKLAPSQLDHAIRLYLSGEPLEQIPAASGVSITRLQRERVARGIPPRSSRDVPTEELVAAYQAGASENALAKQYGVSRGTVAKRLTDAGVTRRDLSSAGTVRAANMSPAERKLQAAAANRAARMRRSSEIEKLRRALVKESLGRHDSPGEELLADMLRERGVQPIPQRAVGVHNVDLAVLPVAVEVLGGGWHGLKATHAERTPYILDEGWHLVMVWDYEGRSALGPGAAEYLISFLEEVRRNPPATSQYRVISGQGELLAACGRESDEFPLVPPPRGRL